MSSLIQGVAVIKQYYGTNKKDYDPVMYEIEVGEDNIMGITEQSAILIYEKLGKFLFPEKGGVE